MLEPLGFSLFGLFSWAVFIAQADECVTCELATPLSPRCSITANEAGRFHLAFSRSCPAAVAVEASICASFYEKTWSTLGAAFLLYDAALMYVASFGGASCFDSSDWSTFFNTSSRQLLSSYTKVLVEVSGTGIELIGGAVTRYFKQELACPLEKRLKPVNWEGIRAVAAAEMISWNQAIGNLPPHWNGLEQTPQNLPLVSCLVPIVWPRQKPFLQAIVETFGQDCDELYFFISSANAVRRDLEMFSDGSSFSVINLHEIYPMVPPDQDEFHRETGDRPGHDSFNTIIKLLHMLRWAGEHMHSTGVSTGQWWYCRLERDTFFIPENFRFLVASERLDASEPHYLGVRQFLDLPRMGLVFNDGGPGVCLSGGALWALQRVLQTMPGVLEEYPDFQRCAFATGHREDLMLAACLKEVKVFPSPVTTDVLGREWFSIRPLRGISTHHPPADPHMGDGQPAWNFWTGRSHLFLPCIQHNRQWIVETPVSFNSFKNTSMFYEAWSLLNQPGGPNLEGIDPGFRLELSGLRRSLLHKKRHGTGEWVNFHFEHANSIT
ncbi:unnamed protein product [Durusdinium trenchii]|uniref:Uncharacterized protein n=1 Tax=Durusdinium trenchii TaxID=1381693 RepID=A0ABP0P0J6_9DINO